MIRLHLRGVAKSFNQRPVFDDVQVTVENGRALVITGANGSGKSTLLRLMCGLLRPSRGQVIVEIDERTHRPAEVRHQFGLVAPDVALYGELTALENMAFFARVRGLSADDARFSTLLAHLGLDDRGHDEVRTYSSGMRHRLKYACALLHRPAILLLDEPSTNLDEDGIAIMRQVMSEQRERGILVFATNDPQETVLADQALRLGRPRGTAQATTEAAPSAGIVTTESAYLPQEPAELATPIRVTTVALHPTQARVEPTLSVIGLLQTAYAVLDKDLRGEFRTKYALNAILLFAVTTLTVVSFAVGQFSLTPEIQAALYWIIVFFSAMSGLARVFVREEEAGTVHALRLAASPTVVYLGKLTFNLILMGILEIVVLPLFVVMMGLRVSSYPLFLAVLVLGSAGLASLATIVAAIVAKANVKSALFTILSFPPLLPLLISCIRATRLALEGADVAAAAPDLRLLIAYSVVIITASLMLFEFVWND